jgi:hypothetical protein
LDGWLGKTTPGLSAAGIAEPIGAAAKSLHGDGSITLVPGSRRENFSYTAMV